MEISNQLPASSPCCPQPDNAGASASLSQTQLAAISTSRSLDLSLTTDEGDKVTLSWDAKAAAMYYQAESTSIGEDGDYLYRQTEMAAGVYQSDFSLAVEGDLNAQEKREIHKVLHVLNKMMKQLARGMAQPDAGTRQNLAGLDTIASLDARLSYTRDVVTANQTQTEVVYNQAGRVSSFEEGNQASDASMTRSDGVLDVLAKEMAQYVHRARAPRAHKLRAVEGLFQRHRRWGGFNQGRAGKAEGIFDALRHRFHAALAQTENQTESSSGT